MLKSPILIIALLLFVEAAVLFVSSRKSCEKYFHFIPPVFWIYAIPMALASSGLIDAGCAWYKPITEAVLPASLVLLLLSADLPAISRLGKTALAMMLAGSLGIMLAVPLVFALVKPLVGAQMWSGYGALSASWIGGSANMIAVKEAVGTPEQVFAPMLLVDTVVPYVWMGLLIAGVAIAPAFDRIIKADRSVLDLLADRMRALQGVSKKFSVRGVIAVLLVAVIGSLVARYLASVIPSVKGVFTAYTWAIVVASCIGLLLSCTPVRRLEERHASKIGYWLLYFVLTTIGAKACIKDVGSAVTLIASGFFIVALQMTVLVIAARVMRAPMFLVATAAQANIGGPASAPVVAAVYEPHLASVGLLMAILGNIMGTYLGIVTAYVCRWISGM